MTSTSAAKDKITYGFHIRVENYCRVRGPELPELEVRLLLFPGTDYYLPWLPWDREGVDLMAEEPNVTGRYPSVQETDPETLELLNWLKLAESAFKFWDNNQDDEWSNL